mmetsp:Transcript_65217/g.199486  ORF Transcript_65217/g.199486 Transcript_65217/m.199486 type:complete len:444 (-) Transcript_65217:1335-2666(-)
MVDDVLLSPQEFLAKHGGALAADALLGVHQHVEVLCGLLDAVAQLHAVGPRGLHRLDDHRHGLALQELLDVRDLGAPRLAHRPKAARLHKLLLDLFVAALGDLRAICPHLHMLGQSIRTWHARLAAANDGHQLRSAARFFDEGLGCLQCLRFCDFGEVLQVVAAQGPVGLHLVGDLLRPQGDDLEAPLERFVPHATSRGVGVNDHDDTGTLLQVRGALAGRQRDVQAVGRVRAHDAVEQLGPVARHRALAPAQAVGARAPQGVRMLLQLEHGKVLLHFPDAIDVLLQRRRVLVHEDARAHVGEQIGGALDLVPGLDRLFEVDERGQAPDLVVPGRRHDLALGERDQHHLLARRLERRGRPVRQGLELLQVQEAVRIGVHLRVAAGQRFRQRHPRAVPPVGAAVHLDEARAVSGHHDLAVRRPVPDLQRDEHAADVGDQHLRLG